MANNISVTSNIVVIASKFKEDSNVKKQGTVELRVLLHKDNLKLPERVMTERDKCDSFTGEFMTDTLHHSHGEFYSEQLYAYDKENADKNELCITNIVLARVEFGIPESYKWVSVILEHDRLNRVSGIKLVDDAGASVDIDELQLRIIKDAMVILSEKIMDGEFGFWLVPEEFTLGSLQRVYELIMGRKFGAFRRYIELTVTPTGEYDGATGHRPSAYFRRIDFNKNNCKEN